MVDSISWMKTIFHCKQHRNERKFEVEKIIWNHVEAVKSVEAKHEIYVRMVTSNA